MKKKLKSLELIKNTYGINQNMKQYFGKEIYVIEVFEKNYNWYGEGWYWKDDWFEPEVELLEDELFEI